MTLNHVGIGTTIAALDSLQTMPHLLLLAGSSASGANGPRSDLDLFCLVQNEDARAVLLGAIGVFRSLDRYRVVRIGLRAQGNRRVSLRVASLGLINDLFDNAIGPMMIWRDVPTSSVTRSREARVRANGMVTRHDWGEFEQDGGWIRELPRFDEKTGEPLATTETSMLISGEIMTSSGFDDGIRQSLWQSFGLPVERARRMENPLYAVLADPRRVEQ